MWIFCKHTNEWTRQQYPQRFQKLQKQSNILFGATYTWMYVKHSQYHATVKGGKSKGLKNKTKLVAKATEPELFWRLGRNGFIWICFIMKNKIYTEKLTHVFLKHKNTGAQLCYLPKRWERGRNSFFSISMFSINIY